MFHRKLFVIAGIFLVSIPLWMYGFVPWFTQLSSRFSYEAEIFSVDNFYDADSGDYSGEQISVTRFSYDVVDTQDGILLIENIFDVQTSSGDPIFSVKRTYGIDPKTGGHVAGYGDKDRDGYLFVPRNVAKKQLFFYWHINYDGPAHMEFVDEEDILGLLVYHYESRYEDVEIDQTNNLTFLPEVGKTRGINLDPHLQLWIEPKTGRMIKYEDDTTAYYYNLATKQRIHPWNKFHNRYTQSSIAQQVRLAKKDILRQTIVRIAIPISFGVLFFAALFGALFLRMKTQKQSV